MRKLHNYLFKDFPIYIIFKGFYIYCEVLLGFDYESSSNNYIIINSVKVIEGINNILSP